MSLTSVALGLLLFGCGAASKSAMSAGASAREEADYGMAYEAEASMASPQIAAAPPTPGSIGGEMPVMDEAMMGGLAKAGRPFRDQSAKKADGTDVMPPEPGPTPVPKPEGDKRTDQSRKPMLIYRADLGLAVFRVQENLAKIEKMAVDAGGYLVARGQTHIKVRVPADTFEKTVDAIVALGDVHRREISADDVTAEFTDLEIRMKNAIGVRDRLQKLLDQAKNVEEALEVERELRRLTDEIEVMKGRMKLLSELAAFSTIDVEFSERTTELKPRVELPFPWLETLGLEYLLSL